MKSFFKKKDRGQIMIFISIIFLSFSMVVIVGLASPMVKQLGASYDMWKSRESYYVSEAAIEDIVYRIKNGMSYNSSGEVLLLNGRTSNISFIGTLDGIEGMKIVSEGNSSNYIKKVQTTLRKGEGISFIYGIQTGKGGFVIDGSSGVIGNVYSNGDIYGCSSCYITGSAIVANSPSMFTDQQNSSPEQPPSSITFGDTNSTQDIAQSFIVSTTSPMSQILLYMKKVGAPSNVTLKVVKDDLGNPSSRSGDVLATGILNASLVTTSYGWIEVPLASPVSLTPDTLYWIVLDGSTGSASKKYIIGSNLDNSYESGTAKLGRLGSSWNPTTQDYYFKIYLGGKYGRISGVNQWNKLKIGTGGTGHAHAHTVDYVQATGDIRCKNGLFNNKECDTTYDDPSYANYPISDANIEHWKEVAFEGGVYNGNYTTPSYGTSTLSARKIVGNLSVSGSHTLYLKGTIWVTGNISLSGNAKIMLDPQTYGNSGGVIVTDGRLTIPGSCKIDGTGQSGSYMLVISTSDCPASSSCGGFNAMEVSGAGGAVILNAQSGTIKFSGSAGAREATAYKIYMDGSTTITYESGLANPSFIDGPSGGFEITYWGEAQ